MSQFKMYEVDYRPAGSGFNHSNQSILEHYKPYGNELSYFDDNLELPGSLLSPKTIGANEMMIIEIDNLNSDS